MAVFNVPSIHAPTTILRVFYAQVIRVIRIIPKIFS